MKGSKQKTIAGGGQKYNMEQGYKDLKAYQIAYKLAMKIFEMNMKKLAEYLEVWQIILKSFYRRINCLLPTLKIKWRM